MEEIKTELVQIDPKIQRVINDAASRPCAICGNPCLFVFSFTPKNKEAFSNMPPGFGIYTSLCGKCVLDRNADPQGFVDFLEMLLAKTGTRVES